MEPRGLGPELRALHTTRRWLLVMLTTLLVGTSALAAARNWSSLSAVEQACAVTAVVLVVAGALTSSRPAFIWLCLAGPFVLLLAAFASPGGSPPWIPMPNVVNYSIGFAITVTSRRVGAACVAIAPITLAVLWQQQSSNVIAGALELSGGWITVAQVLATDVALFLAWWYLVDRAERADARFAERQRHVDASLAQLERSQVWRETALRIHESVLNAIRYVLTSERIDRGRLAREIAMPVIAPDAAPGSQVLDADRLLAATLGDPLAATLIRIPDSRPDVILDPAVFEACRAALVEAARNAQRHGRARRLTVTLAVESPGELTIRAVDDGTGLPSRIQPGIGFGTVLSRAIVDVGGSAVIVPDSGGGTAVVIAVPALTAATVTRRGRAGQYVPFDRGRVLLGSALAGACAVGFLYYLSLGSLYGLDRTGGAHFWLTIVCGLAGSIAALALAVGRRRIPAIAGLGLVLLPAFVPWFLRTADYGCADVASVAAVLNISGFAVLVIALWSGLVPGIVGVLTWAGGVLVVSAQVPADCRQSVILALANSLLIIPIAVMVSVVGVRVEQRTTQRVEQARRDELVERSRAQTALDINASLFDSVEEATGILDDLVAGRPLDDSLRQRLQAVDARIRVAVQVDATQAGGMAEFAKRVVDAAGRRGRTVQVRAIGGSPDPSPVPRSVEDAVIDGVCATVSLQPLLQVFTDGTQDYLSVIVDAAGLRASGLAPDDRRELGSTQVQVIEEGGDADARTRYSIIVSRAILQVAGP